jgi:hypothetical protein
MVNTCTTCIALSDCGFPPEDECDRLPASSSAGWLIRERGYRYCAAAIGGVALALKGREFATVTLKQRHWLVTRPDIHEGNVAIAAK